MTKDAPAFDFYPERWLAGVAELSDAEQLSYLRLLCHQWLKQGLPEEAAKLRRLAGKGVTDELLRKFPVDADGLRRNPRLECIRTEQRARISKSRAKIEKMNAARASKLTQQEALTTTQQEHLQEALGETRQAPSCRLPHHPPPTTHPVPPAVDAIHPPAGAGAGTGVRERPTLEQARAAAPEIGLTPAEAETWWHAREASGWTRSANGTAIAVGHNWRSDARTYTTHARERSHAHPRRTPPRSDTANPPGRYA